MNTIKAIGIAMLVGIAMIVTVYLSYILIPLLIMSMVFLVAKTALSTDFSNQPTIGHDKYW